MSFFRSCLLGIVGVFALLSCRSTKIIQQAIVKKDTVVVVPSLIEPTHADTVQLIQSLFTNISKKQFTYTTFSAKIKVDYSNAKGRQPDFVANIRMQKDSLIWISLGNDIGIEGLRIIITKDSIHVLDKLANTYQVRPLSSIQDISQIPFSLSDLQDLLVGAPLFFNRDSIIAYSKLTTGYTALSIGSIFKNLLTINENFFIEKSKLDDLDPVLNRTADLGYYDYEEKAGFPFSTYREIFISQQNNLSIQFKFKDYRFNEQLTFNFPIPKRFKRIK